MAAATRTRKPMISKAKKPAAVTRKPATSTKAKAPARTTTRKSAPATKAAKTTRTTRKVEVQEPEGRVINELTGFTAGSETDIIAMELLEGGDSRPDIIERLRGMLPEEARTGAEKNVANLVAATFRKMTDAGYTVESFYRLVPPTPASKRAANKRAAEREAVTAAATRKKTTTKAGTTKRSNTNAPSVRKAGTAKKAPARSTGRGTSAKTATRSTRRSR